MGRALAGGVVVDLVSWQVCRVRQLVAVVFVLLASVAPGMACMVPGAQMSAQERACCRTMRGRCGDMKMASGRDCCGTVPMWPDVHLVQWKAPVVHPAIFVTAYFATMQLPGLRALAWDGVARPDASPPPKSPPASNSILRV